MKFSKKFNYINHFCWLVGGQVVAQALRAAGKTVEPSFYVHSMHCYFILAVSSGLIFAYKPTRVGWVGH